MANPPTQQKNVSLNLPPGIGSYVFVVEPRRNDQNGKMEFSLSLLYSKNREKELAPLRAAIQQVAIAKFGPTAPQLLAAGRLRSPIRDGDLDRPDDKNYKGCYFVGARTTRKPGVIDAAKNPVFTDEDVYSGCLIRASVSVFAYDKQGNKGVSCGLNNLQVCRKGERLDGRKDATEEFDEYVDPSGVVDPMA